MRAIVALAMCFCVLGGAGGVSGQPLTPSTPPPLTPSAPPPLAPSAPSPTPSAPPLAPSAPPPLTPSAPPPPAPSAPPVPPSAPPAAGNESGAVTKLSTFTVGNWSAAAFSAPGSMDFDNCAAEVPYDNGVTLGFRVTRAFEWSMAFFNPAWKLTPGASYSLTFTIDYSPPDTATAIAIGVAGVRVPLAPDVALFKRFMGGERLNVTAASENFGFNLTDTSKLLPDLLSCVESYSGAAPSNSNPFAPSRGR